MKKHLAIFNPSAIKQIFSGKKKVESRFSQKKIAPFGFVSSSDLVYIKPPGKEVVGQFFVKKVVYFDGLEESDWQMIEKKFGPKLGLGEKSETDKFFKIHQNAHYATIIYIDRVEQFITSPIKISKKDLRGWVVL